MNCTPALAFRARLGDGFRQSELVEEPPRDDLRLNFGSPFEDVEDARIAEDPADLVFQRKAVAAVDVRRCVKSTARGSNCLASRHRPVDHSDL